MEKSTYYTLTFPKVSAYWSRVESASGGAWLRDSELLRPRHLARVIFCDSDLLEESQV